MNDYSDIIFLMGAMVVFSLLTVQTSRLFQLNNRLQINGEIEHHAVSIAQDEIEQMRWISNELNFDAHISTFPKQVPLPVGGDTLFFNVEAVVEDIAIPNSNVKNERVTVSVENEYLINAQDSLRSVQLQFIKSFN